MNTEIRKELRNEIENHLRPYLQKCYRFYFSGDVDLIELNVKEEEEDISERVIIRVNIKDHSTQLHIPNISFPSSWRGNGDGMKLIDIVYRIARRHDYALFMTFLTEGFYRYLVSCGAHVTDDDTVEILSKTKLVKSQ